MVFSHWLLFVTFALITTTTPGPAVMLAVSNTLLYGRQKALYSSIGNSVGLFMLSCGVIVGLGSLLQASSVFFTVLKVVGGLYLIYLGIGQWRKSSLAFSQLDFLSNSTLKTPFQLFSQGVLVAITNPKAILFFMSLFPQFIRSNGDIWYQFSILSISFSVCAMISHCFYLFFFNAIRSWLTDNRKMKWVNNIVGGVFVFMGISILGLKRA